MDQFDERDSRLVQLRYKVLLDYSTGLRVRHEHIYALYASAAHTGRCRCKFTPDRIGKSLGWIG
jgi:hypothetical protein